MPTPYQRGRALEYAFAAKLREAGWFVIRSAGSKGPFDLVAFNGSRIRLIQCCATSAAKSGDDIVAMLNVPSPPNATKEIWMWDGKEWKGGELL